MSVSKWAYIPERCEGNPCPGDCDLCELRNECPPGINEDGTCSADADMTNEDAISVLLEYSYRDKRTHDAVRLAIAALERDRWISVDERLPKYGDWALGIGPKRGYHVCEYRGITHFPYSGDIPWFSAKGRSLNITHWMPLPEPPKEAHNGE